MTLRAICHNYVFQKQHCMKLWTQNHIFQREESSEDFNEAGLSAQSSSNTDCSSSDRSDDDSDKSVSKIKPEDKDTIEKAKEGLVG